MFSHCFSFFSFFNFFFFFAWARWEQFGKAASGDQKAAVFEANNRTEQRRRWRAGWMEDGGWMD